RARSKAVNLRGGGAVRSGRGLAPSARRRLDLERREGRTTMSAREGSAGSTRPAPGAGKEAQQDMGWPVIHLFQRVNRERWRRLSGDERNAAIEEFSALLAAAQQEERLQLVPTGVVAKADLGLMAIHPDLHRIQKLGQQLAATALGSCLDTVYSFLSISEKS